MFDSKTGKLYDEEDFIDLTDQQDASYECTECGVTLIEYHQAQIANPFAGKSYICPKCHNVTDSSYTPMKGDSTIKPVDFGSSDLDDIIMIVDEGKGLAIPNQEYDVDVEHDKWLESQGFRIVDKKIEVHKD